MMKAPRARLSFTVSSLDCIVCTPIFRRELVAATGIERVKPLPLLNKIVVEFVPAEISEEEVKKTVTAIAEKAGLAGKIIFGK
jgi:hypothetical protein